MFNIVIFNEAFIPAAASSTRHGSYEESFSGSSLGRRRQSVSGSRDPLAWYSSRTFSQSSARGGPYTFSRATTRS